MTIHLNLTPDEASELRKYITNRGGSILAGVENKLAKQAHKFPAMARSPAAILAGQLVDRLEEARTEALDGGDWRVNKIPVIRAIRELCGGQALGLADAKWASENWATFIAFVRQNNHLPEPGFYNSIMR